MKKMGSWIVLACLFLAWGSAALATTPTAAYIRGSSRPWGVGTNEDAMTTVFGPVGVGWDDLRMASGPGPFLPGSGYTFIFLEGSDGTADELNGYLTANRATIEDFVSNGGALLLNSAPNEGGDIDFGFGGVTLLAAPLYNHASGPAAAVDPAHPVFLGPHGTTGASFSGNFFSHAEVTGPAGFSPILTGTSGIILGEMPWGGGFVLFGGMTTNNFHSPQPQATQLRANILAYTAAGAFMDTDGDGLPDWWEQLYGTDPDDPNDPILTEDVDGDGLDWLEEFQNRTNPLVADTDGDGITDGDEVNVHGTNPLVKDPRAVLVANQAEDIGKVYFRFSVTVPDPTVTGFRVFYGASSGTTAQDYVAFFDQSGTEGLIDQRWGLQGVPMVFIRVAPIRDVGGGNVFVGELSNEVSTYFGGERVADSAGGFIIPPNTDDGSGVLDDSDDSDDGWGFCFVQALGGGAGHAGWLGGLTGLAVVLGAAGAWRGSKRKP